MLGNTPFFDNHPFKEGELIIAVSIDTVEYYAFLLSRRRGFDVSNGVIVIIGLPVLHPAFDSPPSKPGTSVRKMFHNYKDISPREIKPPFGTKGRRWFATLFGTVDKEAKLSELIKSAEGFVEKEISFYERKLSVNTNKKDGRA